MHDLSRRKFITLPAAAATVTAITGRHAFATDTPPYVNALPPNPIKEQLDHVFSDIFLNENGSHTSSDYDATVAKHPALNCIRRSMGVASFDSGHMSTLKILAVCENKLIVDLAKHGVAGDKFDAFFYPLHKSPKWWGLQGRVTHIHPDLRVDTALGEITYTPFAIPPDQLQKFNDSIPFFKQTVLPIKFGSSSDLRLQREHTAENQLKILLQNADEFLAIVQSSGGDHNAALKKLVERFGKPFENLSANIMSLVIAGFPSIGQYGPADYILHAQDSRFLSYEGGKLSALGKSCFLKTDGKTYKGMSNGGAFTYDGSCVASLSELTVEPGYKQISSLQPIELAQAFFIEKYRDVAERAGVTMPKDMPELVPCFTLPPNTPLPAKPVSFTRLAPT